VHREAFPFLDAGRTPCVDRGSTYFFVAPGEKRLTKAAEKNFKPQFQAAPADLGRA
jgi:hypothetical protein